VSKQMTLVGYSADGFPIYGPYGYADPKNSKSAVRKLKSSYRLKEGQRPGGNDGPGGKYDGTYTRDYEYAAGAGDLDECNGRSGVTPEYPEGIYYYVLTESFPFIGRMFAGTPDESFTHAGPGPGGRGGPGGEGRPGGPPGRGGADNRNGPDDGGGRGNGDDRRGPDGDDRPPPRRR
jgi:hypothetical protein